MSNNEPMLETLQSTGAVSLESTHPSQSMCATGPMGPVRWLDSDQLLIGSMLGNYYLESHIGRGTTSVVFRGRHRKLGIHVAVKVLRREALEDSAEVLSRLVREAILLAHINHPNVIRLWDLDDEGPHPHLVLEFVSGPTLAELIRKHGRLPVPFAFAFVRQAVEGLAEANRFGIIHRDVKPANLLLEKDGVVKVADLGLGVVARRRLSRYAADSKRQTLPAGTAAYLAPEQSETPDTVDFRADMYALGSTLYHALTGRPMFDGRSTLQVIAKHVKEDPVSPRKLVPELSQECADLIMRMVAKRPQDRFASYEELRTEMGRAVGDRRAPRPLAESFLAFATSQIP